MNWNRCAYLKEVFFFCLFLFVCLFVYHQKLSVVSLCMPTINTRCRIVALSVVVNFMIVEVLNGKELPHNWVCKETQFNSKDGWSKCYYSCAFPVRIFNNSLLLPGKDLHIGKVKLLSYKEYLFVGRTIFSGWSRTNYMLDNFKHYYIYINFMSILSPSISSLSLLR